MNSVAKNIISHIEMDMKIVNKHATYFMEIDCLKDRSKVIEELENYFIDKNVRLDIRPCPNRKNIIQEILVYF